ncbi:NUDIX hydrolase domain-like protein [Zychaea mexicana]|uniref:NUDIX hydrolase domain-like protein n=1 Tax=Zychaea mexicana TaxID=64656 RepID=UPI0022FF10DC|nr:NUDIX hydrolase domain-like protein [Zychaea mexicana]KAI9491720.1 NUDIX hydrolase domain-like protein [Zychaea mexicana]
MFDNFLQVVAHCDKYPYGTANDGSVPIVLNGRVIGNVLPNVRNPLIDYNDNCQKPPFRITHQIEFQPWVDSFDKRTQVVKELMDTWRADGMQSLKGWRNELYPVYGVSGEPDFVMERAATPLFGISTFGVHVNGYTGDKLWVARRSKSKQTWPGLLDNIVAGGISYQYSTQETVVKECDEEASIPSSIAGRAKNAGIVSYYTVTEFGLQPETQYVFDLPIPEDFTPTPKDGEVDEFYLMDMEEVKKTILNNEWKPNCALVTIDFMVRHGILTADNEPDFIDIVSRLHRRLEFPNPRKV